MNFQQEYNKDYIKAKIVKAAKKLGLTSQGQRSTDRLPPGQILTQQFPILDLGVRPQLDIKDFTLKLSGEINNPQTINYEQFMQLPSVTIKRDFHCVTKWSRYDLTWTGVPFTEIAKLAGLTEKSKYTLFLSRDDYSTNLPTSTLLKDDVIVAYKLNDQEGISLLHGGPVRMIVPHLYGWKSAKFIKEIKFMENDQKGFWETRGYHNYGDPWLEQRYS